MSGKASHVRLTKDAICSPGELVTGPYISTGRRSHLISQRSIPWLPRPGAGAKLPSCFAGFLITELLEQQEETVLGGAAKQMNSLQHWVAFPKVQPALALGQAQEMKRVGEVANTVFFRKATREGPF